MSGKKQKAVCISLLQNLSCRGHAEALKKKKKKEVVLKRGN